MYMFPVVWPAPLTPAMLRCTSVTKFSPTFVTTCTSPASETPSPPAPTQGLGGTKDVPVNWSITLVVLQYAQGGAQAGDAQLNARTIPVPMPALRSQFSLCCIIPVPSIVLVFEIAGLRSW